MLYGKEAKEELTKIVQGKCLRVLVYGEDQYGRYIADVYCNGKFVQVLFLSTLVSFAPVNTSGGHIFEVAIIDQNLIKREG